MNKNKLKKLAERVCLRLSNTDLNYLEKSFSVILPMVTKLFSEKITNSVSTMERIISTPLKMSELREIQCQLDTNILNREEIEKNSSLKALKIVVGRKRR